MTIVPNNVPDIFDNNILLNSVPHAITIINSDRLIIHSNQKAKELFPEIANNTAIPCSGILCSENNNASCGNCIIYSTFNQGKPLTREVTISNSKKERNYKFITSIIPDEKSQAQNILLSIEDITSRKIAEQKIANYSFALEEHNIRNIYDLHEKEKKLSVLINTVHLIKSAHNLTESINRIVDGFIHLNANAVAFGLIGNDSMCLHNIFPSEINESLTSIFGKDLQGIQLNRDNNPDNPFIISSKIGKSLFYTHDEDIHDFFKSCDISRNESNIKSAVSLFRGMSLTIFPLKTEENVEGVIAVFADKNTIEDNYEYFRSLTNSAAVELSRQKNSDNLYRSELKYRSLVENSRDMIILCSRSGKINYSNSTFFEKSRLRNSDIINTSIYSLLSPSDAILLRGFVDSAYHDTPGKDFIEVMIQTNKSCTLWLELSINLFPGVNTDFQIVARDITLRKELEHKSRELYERLHQAQKITILSLANLAEYRDIETGHHLERIMKYTEMLARTLSDYGPFKSYISDDYIIDLVNSCPLHDIGKVGIPDSILHKPGILTPEEFNIMKKHTIIGGNTILKAENKISGRSYLNLGKEIAFYHHERWDGRGYPEGLRGNAIPLSSRIVAVADVYDALTTKRPYKEAFTHEYASQLICTSSNTHFDPYIVNAFSDCKSEFLRLKEEYTN